jgi:thymidine phosphorylase
MGMTQANIAVGVFHDPAQAHQALEDLRQAGYSEEEIGYLARADATEPDATTTTSIATRAVEGGIAGGLLGAAIALLIPGFGVAIAGGILVATLSGAALGAATGGIIEALRSLDIPEEEARHYQKELEAGHVVITVQAQSGYADALQILRRNGAHDVATRFSEINADPPIRTFGSAGPEDTGSTPPEQ